MRNAILSLLVFCATNAVAKIPAEYQPVVVEAPFSFSERVFDLSSAVDVAARGGKPLYIYLGAEDCPPCREYNTFLQRNRVELKEPFERVVIVDIRTWLKGPALVFKVGEKRYSFSEFKALVGDTNNPLSYPYYWLLSPSLRQLKQLPVGSRHYMPVEKQLEVLRVP